MCNSAVNSFQRIPPSSSCSFERLGYDEQRVGLYTTSGSVQRTPYNGINIQYRVCKMIDHQQARKYKCIIYKKREDIGIWYIV